MYISNIYSKGMINMEFWMIDIFSGRKAEGEMGEVVFEVGYHQAHSFFGDGGKFTREFIVLQIKYMFEPLMRMLSWTKNYDSCHYVYI